MSITAPPTSRRRATARVGASTMALGVVAASAGLAIVGAASAQAAPAAGSATIRSAHLSPDAPGVDVYLTAFSGGNTRLWVPDEKYGGVSPYTRIAAGQYVVSMRKYGAPASAPSMLSWNLDAKAGQAYTAAAVGTEGKRTGTVLKDDLTPPKAGFGRVRLIQAASRAPEATVVATNGPVVARNAAFPTSTGYAQVPAGTWPLKAQATAGSLSTTTKVSVRSGSVTSLLLLDSKNSSGITLTSVLDAASAPTMPKGPVPAGGGGTAPSAPASGSDGVLAGFGVLGMLSLVAVAARRRLTRATASR